MSRIDISYRRIVQITWPVLITQLTHTAMGVVDTVMVGQLGLTALAGVGLGNYISWWILAFVWGMLSGINTLVAQAFGASRPHAAGVAFWQGLYLALVLAVGLAGAGFAVPWIMAAVGASPETRELATQYMQVRMFFGLGFPLLLVCDNFYRGLGRTMVPMWCGLAQVVVNCGLNYLLIFGHFGAPRLGAVGAAWGTVISQLFLATILFVSIWGSRTYRREFAIRETWRFAGRTFRKLTRLSFPIGVQVFMELGGFTVFCALMAKLGDVQMAATNAVIQAWSCAFMGAFALSITATTLVGQSIGAESPDHAREAVRRVMRLGYVLSAVMSVLYLAIPGTLMSVFVRGEDVARLLPYARPLFTAVVAALIFDTIFNILSGALRGAGDTRYPMLVNVGSSWLVFVPTAYLASQTWGVVGAWWSFALHALVMAALLQWRVWGRAWLSRRLDAVAELAPVTS